MSELAFLGNELQLIRKHQKSGDIFYAVQCTEDLLICHLDLAHTSEKSNIPLRLSLGYNQ
jgi:hypothetical protein